MFTDIRVLESIRAVFPSWHFNQITFVNLWPKHSTVRWIIRWTFETTHIMTCVDGIFTRIVSNVQTFSYMFPSLVITVYHNVFMFFFRWRRREWWWWWWWRWGIWCFRVCCACDSTSILINLSIKSLFYRIFDDGHERDTIFDDGHESDTITKTLTTFLA